MSGRAVPKLLNDNYHGRQIGVDVQSKSFVLLCDDPDARRASGGIGLFMTFRPTKPRWRKALEGSKRGRINNPQ